jgi:hypothetical protein
LLLLQLLLLLLLLRRQHERGRFKLDHRRLVTPPAAPAEAPAPTPLFRTLCLLSVLLLSLCLLAVRLVVRGLPSRAAQPAPRRRGGRTAVVQGSGVVSGGSGGRLGRRDAW